MSWTTPRTWVAGETVTAAIMNTHVRDNLLAIGGAWTTYTPTWSGTTTNPTIGNGTITGRFANPGKETSGSFTITAGSTTTFGSGGYGFTLPTQPLSIVGFPAIGTGNGLRAAALNARICAAVLTQGCALFDAAVGSARLGSATAAWANGDVFSGSYQYENV